MSNMIEHAKTLERTGLTREQAEALVQVIMNMIRADVDALEARLGLKFDAMDAKLEAMEKQFQVLRFNVIAGNAALVIGFVGIIIALLVK